MISEAFMSAPPTIFIIDDDASIRRALRRVMASAGFLARDFVSVEEFLGQFRPQDQGCVVADMTLFGMSGLELKRHLNAAGSTIPVILLTAQDTDEARRQAGQAGAAGYFRKPVDTQALLDAIEWSLQKMRSDRAKESPRRSSTADGNLQQPH